MDNILNICLTEMQSFFDGDLLMVASSVITIALVLLGITVITGILSSIHNPLASEDDEREDR